MTQRQEWQENGSERGRAGAVNPFPRKDSLSGAAAMRGHTRHGWFAVAVMARRYRLVRPEPSPFAVCCLASRDQTRGLGRYFRMTVHRDLIDTFRDQIDRALEAGDTDRAEALAQRLEALQSGETSYLRPQRPGAMGLGTSDEVPRRPPGWTPPKKPNPMTAGASRRRR